MRDKRLLIVVFLMFLTSGSLVAVVSRKVGGQYSVARELTAPSAEESHSNAAPDSPGNDSPQALEVRRKLDETTGKLAR